jgi:hypothetical protein
MNVQRGDVVLMDMPFAQGGGLENSASLDRPVQPK